MKRIDPLGWAGLALIVLAGVVLITADKILFTRRRSAGILR